MNADKAERPRPGRSELRQSWQRQREELSSHDLEAPIGRTPHAHAQRPERSPMTILRPLFVEPAAVETHVVVEAFYSKIESVVQERRIGCGQRPHALWLFSQFTEQDREDECASVVIRTVAFGKIRDAKNGMLEDPGRIGHPREMTQLQLRQFPRLLVERLGGERFSRSCRPLDRKSVV